MKLLALTNNMREKDGWGRYAASVAREYIVQCPDFEVITEEMSGKEHMELHERALLLPLRSEFNFFRNCWRTRCAARSVDVVHAFDGWPYSVYGYAAVVGTTKKLFITGVGTYSVAAFENPLQRMLMTRAYRRAQNIFCVSRYTQQRILEKVALKNTSIVPWGHKALPELTAEEKERYRERFDIGNEHPVILTVGQIKQRKGQYDTLRAVARLRERYPQLLYLMVGSDSDIEYIGLIQDFIKEHNLFGNVRIINNAEDDSELSFFYSICDIFAMNSRNDGEHFEGFGLVFLEAMQFGKPVVGSSGCGIEDAITDGYNGYLAAQGDDESIYQAFMKILSGDRDMLSRNARTMYSQFSWKKTVAEYVRNYHL